MGKHSDIKRQYRETPREAGIFQVRNKVNGRVLLGSSKNMHGPLNKHRFLLSTGSHWNKKMQEDWDRFGAEAFTFEVLELVHRKDDPSFDLETELELLEEVWIEKIRPFDGDGYNRAAKIRE